MDQPEQREAELMRREAAIQARERAIRAKEALEEANLPQALAGHLDLSSDEALAKSLALAREAARLKGENAMGAPKASAPKLPGNGGYAQRALLYQTDLNNYLEQYKGEK